MGTATLPSSTGPGIHRVTAGRAQTRRDGTNSQTECLPITGRIIDAVPLFAEAFATGMGWIQIVSSPTELIVGCTTGGIQGIAGLPAEPARAGCLVGGAVFVIANQSRPALTCAATTLTVPTDRIGDASGPFGVVETGVTSGTVIGRVAGKVFHRIEVVKTGTGKGKAEAEAEHSHGWAPTKAATPRRF